MLASRYALGCRMQRSEPFLIPDAYAGGHRPQPRDFVPMESGAQKRDAVVDLVIAKIYVVSHLQS